MPLSAVLITDYFVVSRGHWDLSAAACPRWLMLPPWAAGFVTYQFINPGYVSWWASQWTSLGHDIGFTPASWMSASILSFAVSALITLPAGWLAGLVPRAPARSGGASGANLQSGQEVSGLAWAGDGPQSLR